MVHVTVGERSKLAKWCPAPMFSDCSELTRLRYIKRPLAVEISKALSIAFRRADKATTTQTEVGKPVQSHNCAQRLAVVKVFGFTRCRFS